MKDIQKIKEFFSQPVKESLTGGYPHTKTSGENFEKITITEPIDDATKDKMIKNFRAAGGSGLSQTSGTSGSSGTSGTSGIAGAAGLSALSATSGSSGTNGSNGANERPFGVLGGQCRSSTCLRSPGRRGSAFPQSVQLIQRLSPQPTEMGCGPQPI